MSGLGAFFAGMAEGAKDNLSKAILLNAANRVNKIREKEIKGVLDTYNDRPVWEQYSALSDYFMRKGDTATALALKAQAERSKTVDTQLKMATTRNLMNIATLAFKMGNMDTAKEAFNKAVEFGGMEGIKIDKIDTPTKVIGGIKYVKTKGGDWHAVYMDDAGRLHTTKIPLDIDDQKSRSALDMYLSKRIDEFVSNNGREPTSDDVLSFVTEYQKRVAESKVSDLDRELKKKNIKIKEKKLKDMDEEALRKKLNVVTKQINNYIKAYGGEITPYMILSSDNPLDTMEQIRNDVFSKIRDEKKRLRLQRLFDVADAIVNKLVGSELDPLGLGLK